MGDTPMGWSVRKHAYERHAYERPAYEMAYERGTPMRDMPTRWPL